MEQTLPFSAGCIMQGPGSPGPARALGDEDLGARSGDPLRRARHAFGKAAAQHAAAHCGPDRTEPHHDGAGGVQQGLFHCLRLPNFQS